MVKDDVTSIFLIAILLLLIGCSSGAEVEIPDDIKQLENLTVISPEAEPSHAIDFEQEAVFGGTEDVILGQIASVAVDNQGRVFIADRDQNIIHSYRPDGRYLRQLGNEGKGPGEFSSISILRHQHDQLYAQDFRQRRVNVYQLDSLQFSHAIPLSRKNRDIEELSGTYPASYFIRSDGKLLVDFSESLPREEGSSQRTLSFYVIDQEGKIVSDRIFQRQSREFIIDRSDNGIMFMAPPYGRKSLLSVGDNNKLYTSWTEDFLIKVHSSDGSYQKAIYRPYHNIELDLNEVVKEYDNKQQKNMLRNADNPSTWPAIDAMKVDDKSRLWISTITDNKDIYQWWVISSEGDLLAKFSWPRTRSIEVVKDGKVYTQETDEETGLEQIVKYRIELS
jgi:hypothetical protein